MPPSKAAVSVQEYLTTDYSPDVDYVDGELEDRNVGQKRHALAQALVLDFLRALGRRTGLFVVPEQRLRIASAKFRVPDVCVMLSEPEEEVFTSAPFICIEILSPDDTMSRMQHKIHDYLDFGVKYVWIIDPYERTAWTYTSFGAAEVKDGVLRTEDPEIAMPLNEVLP